MTFCEKTCIFNVFREESIMTKRFRLAAVSLAASFLLTACGGSGTQSAPSAPTVESDGSYTVGICQLVQHVAHDDATQGFMDALNDTLPNQVTFVSKVASNDISACSGIVNQFIAEEVDLILANATPALQIASAATAEIPILGTSVTEYGAALGIEGFDGTIGGNISGTSDLAPPDAQAAMIAEWFPEAKTIGLLYCSAEANSEYQVSVVAEELAAMGYTCKDFAFTDSNDLTLVLQGATEVCDAIYVPTDNTVASNSSIIDNICRPAGVPVIGGDQGICESCTVATLCITYYDLGYATGKMAAQILSGEADISEMPIQYTDASRIFNTEICAALGLTPPSDAYQAINAG